jgi:hypothetical protein
MMSLPGRALLFMPVLFMPVLVMPVLVMPALVIAWGPVAAAENLPVTVERYSQACVRAGGGVTRSIDASGAGSLLCLWSQREGTECGVTSSQVMHCIIRCGSEACYAANPEKDRPTWPLDGGPHLKKLKVPTDLSKTPMLAPAN